MGIFSLITFNSISAICIAVMAFTVSKKTDFVFYTLCFTAVLTTVAAFNIENNSVLLFHLIFLVVLVKFIFMVIKEGTAFNISKMLCLFFLWCVITIPFSALHKNIIVMNIDSNYENIKFSFQQFTQLAYLLIGFSVCFICNSFLLKGKISYEKVMKVLDASYVVALCLALLQLILPPSICTAFFRNSTHAAYGTYGARISGPFNEPSMLALVCTPFFCGYLYRFLNRFQMKYFIYCVLFLAVMLSNRSSSAMLGVVVGLVVIVLIKIIGSNGKFTNKQFLLSIFAIITVISTLFIFRNGISEVINLAIGKFDGVGVSGSERTYSFNHHINLFLKNIDIFLFGVGYGTIRSFDLLSTWACELGIIGLILYFVPIAVLCSKLIRKKNEDLSQLAIIIVVYNSILFVSTCEIMFLQIWIIYGASYYLVQQTSEANNFSNAFLK